MNRVVRNSSSLAYYYSVLGVSSDLSKKEIKAAFLEKAVKHHPGLGSFFHTGVHVHMTLVQIVAVMNRSFGKFKVHTRKLLQIIR